MAHVLTNYNYKRRVARLHFLIAKAYSVSTIHTGAGGNIQRTKPMWLLVFTHFTNSYVQCAYIEYEYGVVYALVRVESYRYHCSIKSKMMLPFFVFRYILKGGKNNCEITSCHTAKNVGKCRYTFFCICCTFKPRWKCLNEYQIYLLFLKLPICGRKTVYISVYVYTYLLFNLSSSNLKIMANATAVMEIIYIREKERQTKREREKKSFPML